MDIGLRLIDFIQFNIQSMVDTHTYKQSSLENTKSMTGMLGLLGSFHWPEAINKVGSPIARAQGLLCPSTCHLSHESPYVMPR